MSGEYPNGNTAIGHEALDNFVTGINLGMNNTALGMFALRNLQNDRNESTAVGAGALESNVLGENTAVGAYALAVGNGTENTAVGNWTLRFNEGTDNTAVGYRAMAGTLGETDPGVGNYGDGKRNTALGAHALRAGEDGHDNVAVGHKALYNNAFGEANVAVGNKAGLTVTVAGEDYNTLLGADTDIASGVSYGTAVGAGAKVEQDDSIVLGRSGDYVGIGTNKPAASLHVEGGIVGKVTHAYDSSAPASVNFYPTVNDYFIVVTSTGVVANVILPAPSASTPGHIYIIKNMSGIAITLKTTAGVATDIQNGAGGGVASLSIAIGKTCMVMHDSISSSTPTYHVLNVYV